MQDGGEREVSAGQAASRGSWRARGARLGSGFGQNARLAGRMAVGWRALARGGSAWWWVSGGPDRSLNLLHPLGGTTGYAINPARDLGPRMVFALIPRRSKASADWGSAWVLVVGKLLGVVAAALLGTARQ